MVSDNNHSDERQIQLATKLHGHDARNPTAAALCFRHLDRESLDEAVEEGLVHCLFVICSLA